MKGSTLLPSLALLFARVHAQAASSGSDALVLDDRLHRVFDGIAYSPSGVILPDCGATQADVTADMFTLAQLTPSIRLYGSDCNTSALVLQGIQDAGNVDLSVHLAVAIPYPTNQTVVDLQLTALLDAVKTYGTEHVAGIIIGNEYILNGYGTDGSGSATDPRGLAARIDLLAAIKAANETIQAANLDKQLPVGTADAGSALTTSLCEGIDFFMANVHPWFGSVTAEQAPGWTWNFFQEFDVDVCANASNHPEMFIAEVGWPTNTSDTTKPAVNGANAPASVADLQTFIDGWVCTANKNFTDAASEHLGGYFFFEFKDEPWKEVFGGIEPWWGLFTSDRTLKDGLKIPDSCLVESPTGGKAPTSVPSGAATGSRATQTRTRSADASGTSGSDSSSALTVSVPCAAWFLLCLIALY